MDFEKEARDFWDDALSWVSAQQENWVCRKEVETLIRRAFIAGQIEAVEALAAFIHATKNTTYPDDHPIWEAQSKAFAVINSYNATPPQSGK
ncbi:MAG: hypothetical protein KF802_16425 [Bdellovibrionaceae bacterium]|nr:hypothetical protein [Pseudobdellovibrionaceae bacterium]